MNHGLLIFNIFYLVIIYSGRYSIPIKSTKTQQLPGLIKIQKQLDKVKF
jgi:hypothetical protein